MVQGPLLFLILLLGVGFIVLATAKFKLHPFLSLLIAAFGVGIATGLPLNDVVKAVNEGFGGPEDKQAYIYQAGVFWAAEGCAIGFRREKGIITNLSQFVPHVVEG